MSTDFSSLDTGNEELAVMSLSEDRKSSKGKEKGERDKHGPGLDSVLSVYR